MIKMIFNTIKSVWKLIFSDPETLVANIEGIFPDIVLISLLVLIILRYIGFKGTSKYIALTLILAVLVAMV